jgi:hypothetical protein
MQGAAILFSLSEPYKVVRIEAPSIHDRPLTCFSCGAPLRSREGKFALKYFRTDGREDLTEKMRLFSKNVIWAE